MQIMTHNPLISSFFAATIDGIRMNLEAAITTFKSNRNGQLVPVEGGAVRPNNMNTDKA